jgi:hypothetical protein
MLSNTIEPEDVVGVLKRTASEAQVANYDTRAWTHAMLGALAGLATHAGHAVRPHDRWFRDQPPTKRGEFLWDLVILDDTEPILVAESEWGRLNGIAANESAVLEDFEKLFLARSPLKVMIFSYHESSAMGCFDALSHKMELLIRESRDDATYVLFGVSWQSGQAEHRIVRREKLIQFMHPGGERSASSNLAWNHGRHARTFLVAHGVDDRDESGELCFWGEWEARVEIEKSFASEIVSGPRKLLRPRHSLCPRDGTPQNTDPFVFGDQFLYSCCKQVRRDGRATQLRELGRGDILLFGSQVDGRFVLDTVFVVARSRIYDPRTAAETASLGSETVEPVFQPIQRATGGRPDAPHACTRGCARSWDDQEEDACIQPLHAATVTPFRLYEGATVSNPIDGMYSFVPAKWTRDAPHGFARPTLSLPNLRHALNINYADITEQRVSMDWHSIVDELRGQGFALAVKLALPR